MKAFWTVGWVVAGALLTGTIALAQAPVGGMGPGPGFGEHRPPMEKAFGPGGEHGRWWNNPKLVAELKLTDEQRKVFDGILLAHREKLIDLRASLEKAELALEPLMRDDQPNETKILAQIDKVAQARAALEKANAGFLLAIRGKLTPEQWKLLQADRANRRAGGAGEQRGPRPGGWRQGAQYHRQAPPPEPDQPAAEPAAPAAPQPGAEE